MEVLRAVKVLAAVGLVLGLSGSVAMAADGGAQRVQAEVHPPLTWIPVPAFPLPGDEAVKTEVVRHDAAMQPIVMAIANLRAAMHRSVRDGATPEAATKLHADKAKELAKKLIAEYTTYQENMAKIAKENSEAAVDAMAEQILKFAPAEPAVKPMEKK